MLLLCLPLAACQAALASPGASGEFKVPALQTTTYDASEAISARGCSIDTSNAADGYIMASGTSSDTLKLSLICNGQSHYFDMPNNGEIAAFPLLEGDGTYIIRIMENISGNDYIQLLSTTCTVTLKSEFEPFLRPNAFCEYDENSSCVALARSLVAQANTQAEAANAIYEWVVSNISYNKEKAETLANVSSYIPDPDQTLASRSGICFDYASLTAAMLRSVGIPTKIITGYVYPSGIYHAWNMVYLDGRWTTTSFTIDPNSWGRIDTTFAAASAAIDTAGGGEYEDKFTY